MKKKIDKVMDIVIGILMLAVTVAAFAYVLLDLPNSTTSYFWR